MVGEIFRAGARALDDLEQQQQHAGGKQHVAERDLPLFARQQGQPDQRVREGHAGHQESDDVVDRERNEQ
ncbi:hypothetical protein chiPu_0029873, partial [Chiloscyllium punctatum]|nr:hypothetical protein [Chiloscyllium punctatum]